MNELIAGIVRLFPNTMIAALFVVGILFGKISWIFVSIGGVLMAIVVTIFQYVFQQAFSLGQLPGDDIMQACSIIRGSKGTYSTIPSMWITLTTFFTTFILTNAVNVSTTSPALVSKDAISVQQRKGIGAVSIATMIILFLFMLVWRVRPMQCESIIGSILGIGLGIGGGYAWWVILNACGSNVYPDIHGVMIGLKPGTLRTAPLACTPP